MKKIPVNEAVGQVLCHDHTRIVKGEMKGPWFRKGHIVRREDIPLLLDMGKEHIYVWEAGEGYLHEDDAAARLAALCAGDNIGLLPPSEGKINMSAEADGLFQADVERLERVNSLENMVISCRHSLSPVRKGDLLAGARVIPLVIHEEAIKEAEAAAGGEPLFRLLPYKLKSAWIITTGSEVSTGRIEDTFTPVLLEKLTPYGIDIIGRSLPGDDTAAIEGAISEARAAKAHLILCAGGMSVDPDDNTPGAIKQSGARIITYGAPVLPGAMFLLGYYEDGAAVMGLPGCVMYAGASIFDIVLPRVAAGIKLSKGDFAAMGNGGLCLGCDVCRFPICPYCR